MNLMTDPPIATPRRGFDSLEAETQILGLPIQGQLPPWLEGSLLRTGPAKV
jgi:beta,beta-carotene 9',10'-dioxygenase